jgi:uncharacterized protein (TIGR03083 family)
MNDRDLAMTLAAHEYERFVALLKTLGDDDWHRRTECPEWDVRAMVAHVCGATEGLASMREQVHQMLTARKRAQPLVDALGVVQIADRAGATPAELVARIERAAPKSIKGRRRIPGFVRAFKMTFALPLGTETWPLSFLHDTIYTRDAWMHRVDISRATQREMEFSARHDGVLVADVVREWAERHGKPYHLVLTGPAGGEFGEDGGEGVGPIDAVEFCRIVSGRSSGSGLLTTEVPF